MEPTTKDLQSLEFQAIWEVVRNWDISRENLPEFARSYSGATGTDVMAILQALRALPFRFEQEVINPGFTKWHIRGLPVAAAIHIFTEANDIYPHDHPWDFVSYVIRGAYEEEVYEIDHNYGNWYKHHVLREHGESHKVAATRVHRITELPYGTCWTFVVQEPKVRDWLEWDFRPDGIYNRVEGKGEFVKYNQP